MMTRRLALRVLGVFLIGSAVPLGAQVGPPNTAGVSVGHVHLTVRNPDEHKKLWVLLGGQVTRSGSLELVKFPGIFVVLTQGSATEGSEGSTVNHFGFQVRNVDEVRAKLTAVG